MGEPFDWIPHRAKLHELAARYRRADRWAPVPAELDRRIALDDELAAAGRAVREHAFAEIRKLPIEIPPGLTERFAAAWAAVPRERFVLPEDIALSVEDEPLALDPRGEATVSAPHAYLLTYALLDLTPGDRLLELGTGTGYGAALARRLVGPGGHVTTVEVDPHLHERAKRLLGNRHDDEALVDLVFGDARSLGPDALRRERPNKIAFTYAIQADPLDLVSGLARGGRLVAPVGRREKAWTDTQELVLFEVTEAGPNKSTHGGVRYVAERRPAGL